MWKAKDLKGMRFEKLTVIERVANDKRGQSMWLCKCDCGKEIVTNGYYLTTGHTRSCGCLHKEHTTATHGMSNTDIYHVWATMKRRCYAPANQKYKNYGARGIRICDEWKNDFSVFYKWALENGYKKGLTIDRIDVNGNYCPENCKWSTYEEQAQNKTNSKNIELRGQSKSLSAWGRETGICRKTITNRLNRGWSVERALTTPVKKVSC